MARIGIIGMTPLGKAVLAGLLREYAPEDIVFAAESRQEALDISSGTLVAHLDSVRSLARNVQYLLIASGDPQYPEVLHQLRSVYAKGLVTGKAPVILSLSMAYSLRDLKEQLGVGAKIARAVVSIAAREGKSAIAVSYERKDFLSSEAEGMEKILSALGKTWKIPEDQMDAACAISGCAPAYVYMFLSALKDAGIKYGMRGEDAQRFSEETLKGILEASISSPEDLEKLKDEVCAPGGRAIRGVQVLEENRFRAIILEACDACVSGKE